MMHQLSHCHGLLGHWNKALVNVMKLHLYLSCNDNNLCKKKSTFWYIWHLKLICSPSVYKNNVLLL